MAAALAMVPAALVVSAYTLDRAGVAFPPTLMLVIGLAAGVGTTLGLRRHAVRDDEASWALAAIVIGTFGWLFWIARPAFLPLGTGPDLTHHLQLIGYLETHWRLVHDAGVEPYLGEMVHYTPGSHVIAALAGAWSGTSGLRALHAVLAATVALKAGFVFLIARRLLPESVPRAPIAMVGALSLYASHVFFLGSFLEYSFVAQVIAELFVVVSWWALVVWHQQPTTHPLSIAAVALAAVFLTWPVLVGPPLLLLGLLVLTPGTLPLRRRVGQALLIAAPVLVYGVLFISGRSAWVQLAGTGGKTAWPVPAAYGWPFLAVSTLGLLAAFWRHRSWPVGLFACAVLAQAGALYLVARGQHHVPYMALKMFYVLLCAQAVGVALAVGEVWDIGARMLASRGHRGTSIPIAMAAWVAAACVLLAVARPLIRGPRGLSIDVRPAVSRPLELAGEWARAHIPSGCVEYLVGDDETAYWLHLAVLGNPRMSARTGDNDTYELTPTLVRWLTPGGLPYAIADLPALPRGVRDELDVVATFDSAAVVRRRGPASCAESR